MSMESEQRSEGSGGLLERQQVKIGLVLMATHSSILAWRIPWTEELGRL